MFYYLIVLVLDHKWACGLLVSRPYANPNVCGSNAAAAICHIFEQMLPNFNDSDVEYFNRCQNGH